MSQLPPSVAVACPSVPHPHASTACIQFTRSKSPRQSNELRFKLRTWISNFPAQLGRWGQGEVAVALKLDLHAESPPPWLLTDKVMALAGSHRHTSREYSAPCPVPAPKPIHFNPVKDMGFAKGRGCILSPSITPRATGNRTHSIRPLINSKKEQRVQLSHRIFS